MPSYVGNNISNKPAYLKRNEKFHKKNHNEYIPTIEEAIKMIEAWQSFKNSQICSNEPDKTIAEVLKNRTKQNIDKDELDDLMLAQEIKTIHRNGIRFLNADYFNEELYGLKGRAIIKYSLFDLSSVKVFSTKGEFLCTADRITATHPMAAQLGDINDLEDFKQKIQKQRKLRRKTLNEIKNYLPKEDVKFTETQMEQEKPLKAISPVKQLEKKYFKNSYEKFEVIRNKSELTNQEQEWILLYQKSNEYKLMYGE